MLYAYPLEATNENWLHDSILEMIEKVHTGMNRTWTEVDWPGILPATLKVDLSTRSGLKKKLNAYGKAIKRLPKASRDQILITMHEQNKIEDLLACKCDCSKITSLDQNVQNAVKSLFDYMFYLLTELGIRDRQYAVIYQNVRNGACPFCGCEYFEPPGEEREDLDHYLAESIYTFAGANLHNLVPMGHKCNSRYKKKKDVLNNGSGRRRAIYPFNNNGVLISLDKSIPFTRKNGFLPEWDITFMPDCEEVDTWEEVFCIRRRYSNSILDTNFDAWLEEFRSWCLSYNGIHLPFSPIQLPELLEYYSNILKEKNFLDRSFLKVAVFDMLKAACINGHQVAINYLLRIVNTAGPKIL